LLDSNVWPRDSKWGFISNSQPLIQLDSMERENQPAAYRINWDPAMSRNSLKTNTGNKHIFLPFAAIIQEKILEKSSFIVALQPRMVASRFWWISSHCEIYLIVHPQKGPLVDLNVKDK
jgi:hypothetical protein